MWPDMQPWPVRQFGEKARRFADAAAFRSVVKMTLRGAWREPERGPYLPRFQSVESELPFLDSPNAGQYGPRGFRGAGVPQRRRAASVESMSDDAREQGDDGNAQTDEAALSARLQRLSERLARDQPGRGGSCGAMTSLSAIRITRAETIASATLTVPTSGEGFFEITRELAGFLKDAKARDGMLLLFLRHTSASLVIQENADPDVRVDLVTALDRLALADGSGACGEAGGW